MRTCTRNPTTKIFLLFIFLALWSVDAFCQIESVNTTPLTKGWDNYDLPLKSGKVIWQVSNGNNLRVTFQLLGAKPNHSYTVGVHFMNSKPFDVKDFLGRRLAEGSSLISREGSSTYVIGYDFGQLNTDSSGSGQATFEGKIPDGRYQFQYTVRIGECIPSEGITSGCACVYRTGLRFAEIKEIIDIGGSSRSQANLTKGWDVFNVPLNSGTVFWYVSHGGNLQVTFQLHGAKPNHSYTVGAHLMDSKHFDVAGFLGERIGEASSLIKREGRDAYVLGYDFGTLTTDSNGYGQAQYIGIVPTGNYQLQFTVRIGTCLPSKGITDGCSCVYRTGEKFGTNLEHITIY